MDKILIISVLMVLLSAILAAPLKETKSEDVEADNTEEMGLKQIEEDTKEDDTSKNIDIVTEKPKTDSDTDKTSEKQDLNEEVTNYQNIEVDSNSRVTGVTQEENTQQQDGLEAKGLLSDDEAEELLLELSDPESVAQYIVEKDDASGFLRALRLLKDQGFITLDMAYYLHDQVTSELKRMLWIQRMELSTAFLNNYQDEDYKDQMEEFKDASTPYYIDEFNNYLPETDYIIEQVPYSDYQTEETDENSEALAEIANIISRRIAEGELTPESGVKIMATVSQLLPESYWRDALEIFANGNMYYPSSEALSSEVDSLGYEGDLIDQSESAKEFLDEDDDESENEEDEEDDGAEIESDEDEEEIIESNQLENQLLGKEDNMEQALANQLVEKAKAKAEISEPKEDDLTEDSYGFLEALLQDEYYRDAFTEWRKQNENQKQKEEQKPIEPELTQEETKAEETETEEAS